VPQPVRPSNSSWTFTITDQFIDSPLVHYRKNYVISGLPRPADNRVWDLRQLNENRARLNGLFKRHYGIYTGTATSPEKVVHVTSVEDLIGSDTA